MNLHDRLMAQLDEFASYLDWNLSVTRRTVQLSNRGQGPGVSLYAETACGVTFEEELRADDDVAAVIGVAVH